MDLQLFAILISNLLNVNVTSISGDKQKLLEFENRFCFNEVLQPMFTAQALGFLIEPASESTIFEISDGIEVNLLFFRFGGLTFLVGPYVKNEYNDIKMQSVLAERGLSASYSASLKLYYTSLPLISTFHAQKEIESCIMCLTYVFF